MQSVYLVQFGVEELFELAVREPRLLDAGGLAVMPQDVPRRLVG